MGKDETVYNRHELLTALSLALDLAESKPIKHASRAAYVALQIARTLKLPEDMVEDIYIASYLHDIGITGPSIHSANLLETEFNPPIHSENANQLMTLMPFSERAAQYVLMHHSSWDKATQCQGKDAPLGARIIHLADQLESRYNHTRPYFEQMNDLQEWVRGHRDCSPDVADAFLEVSSREKFWLDFTCTSLDWILKEIQPQMQATLTQQEVEQIANVFAAIIDSKSSFTYRHSRGVAELMERLAPMFLDSEEEIFQLRIAALLHDLGKLAVPQRILDKPGRLTPLEFERIKAHPYYTKFILSHVRGFEVIKEWAGNHHESVDGRGYPERREELSVPERLMAVVDVYQALTEERPYRTPMTQSEALDVMKKMVQDKKLCVAGVALLQEVI